MARTVKLAPPGGHPEPPGPPEPAEPPVRRLLAPRDDGELPERENPALFGVDLVDAVVGAIGAAGAGYVNDRIVQPAVRPLVGGFSNADNTIGQILDGVTTILSAVGIGRVVELFDRHHGMVAQFGGGIYGGGKILAAFVPGFSLSARFPEIPGFPQLGGPPRPAANGAAAAQMAAPSQPLAVF